MHEYLARYLQSLQKSKEVLTNVLFFAPDVVESSVKFEKYILIRCNAFLTSNCRSLRYFVTGALRCPSQSCQAS